MSDEALQRQVLEAVKALEIPKANESHVSEVVKFIVWRLDVTPMMSLLPAIGTEKGAIDELRQLERAVGRLYHALSSCSLTASERLRAARDNLGLSWSVSTPPISAWLDRNYPGLEKAARYAADQLEGSGEIAPQRGRQGEKPIRDLARLLADSYFRLTGRRPARGDNRYEKAPPFLAFVQAIFEAGRIDANAEHYVRWAVNDFNRKCP